MPTNAWGNWKYIVKFLHTLVRCIRELIFWLCFVLLKKQANSITLLIFSSLKSRTWWRSTRRKWKLFFMVHQYIKRRRIQWLRCRKSSKLWNFTDKKTFREQWFPFMTFKTWKGVLLRMKVFNKFNNSEDSWIFNESSTWFYYLLYIFIHSQVEGFSKSNIHFCKLIILVVESNSFTFLVDWGKIIQFM